MNKNILKRKLRGLGVMNAKTIRASVTKHVMILFFPSVQRSFTHFGCVASHSLELSFYRDRKKMNICFG